MSTTSKIARVETETLSDKSKVFNVVVSGDGVERTLVIGAHNEQYAIDIERAINNGASWIVVR